MDNERNDKPSSPWRQPVVWLMVALVSASVIGSVVMFRIAGGDGSVDSVSDDVRRTAGAQTTDLGPDEVALQRRLSAVVRVDLELGVVQALPVSGEFDREAPLRLWMRHPVREASDLEFVLAPTELGWEATADVDAGHDWNLELASTNGEWRLLGRLPKEQQAARVAPALQAGADPTPDP